MERRYFLSFFLSIFVPRSRIRPGPRILAALSTMAPIRASSETSAVIVSGVLGECVELGGTGRLCIFGQALSSVKRVVFDAPSIKARIVSSTAEEIIVDISVPQRLQLGSHRVFLEAKTGIKAYSGCVFVAAVGMSGYCSEKACDPITPGWPKTPGWPGQQSESAEQYYDERRISSGLGAALL
jgi:hypothetical protein